MSSEATNKPAGLGAHKAAGKRKAGVFDIRLIIALLLGIYGAVLTVMGFSTSDADLAKAAGVNINLWAGIAMLIVALFFVVWAFWRPLVVFAGEGESPAEDSTVNSQADSQPDSH